MPDQTILTAMASARPEVFRVMLNHPSADTYFPNREESKPGAHGGIITALDNMIGYGFRHLQKKVVLEGPNSDAPDADRLSRRHECMQALLDLHRKRHAPEQLLLEEVMGSRLSLGDNVVRQLADGLLTCPTEYSEAHLAEFDKLAQCSCRVRQARAPSPVVSPPTQSLARQIGIAGLRISHAPWSWVLGGLSTENAAAALPLSSTWRRRFLLSCIDLRE